MERLYQSLIKRPQFGYKTTLLFLGGKRVYQWSLNRLVPESSGFPSADEVGNEDEENGPGQSAPHNDGYNVAEIQTIKRNLIN